jgi:geranylgeranyl diphosphate synthase type II
MAIDLFRSQIEEALRRFIEQMGEKNHLRDACEYSLLNGGKRLRPILVLMIAEALNLGADVMPAALSVEFFHTASLIADDLPCMDNDDMRRNRPSVHKAFGESVAVLASYALIAEGYGGIYRNSQNCPESAVLCLEAATRCAGINGATNGQFLDLYPPNPELDTIKKIIYQKTVTLFEIAFVFGWLFGGGSAAKLSEVNDCAYHLGMAFQIADDLLDEAEDSLSPINIAKACGRERALILFEEEMEAFTSSLKELGLWNIRFQEVAAWLRQYGTAVQTK